MSKKILKINSWFLIILSLIVLLLFTMYFGNILLTPSEPNSWDDLGKAIVIVWGIIVFTLNSPLLISGKATLDYLKGKNTYKLSKAFSIIGIILFLAFLFIFVYIDNLNIFKDYTTGEIYIKKKIIVSAIIFFLFILSQIINVVELYKYKNNLTFKDLRWKYLITMIIIVTITLIISIYNLNKSSIINENKIDITEDNVYSYHDFVSELEDRNLIYDLPEGKIELSGIKQITALDSSYKYGYRFSSGTYTDAHTLSVDDPRKFPMFIYETYTSLIKKSDNTADYYYIGLEDWYITWYIYYVNGKIYAAIGEESEYGKNWEASLSGTKYAVVISEEPNITIYNAQKNYYIYGGGILSTRSGMQSSGFPTTTNIYDEKCMKIKVVDRVDAETLDKIAKELSPQYWKTYKSGYTE